MRLPRLNLAQVFLLVALAALILSVINILNYRWNIDGGVPPIAVSPDGGSLATGISRRPRFERRNPITVRDLTDESTKDQLYEHHDWSIEGVAYSPDGKTLYSVADNTLRGWDTKTAKEILRIDTGSDVRACLAVSPDGKFVVTANDKDIRVWDIEEQKIAATLGGHAKGIGALAFSPDGSRLVSGEWGKTLNVWNSNEWFLESSTKLNTTTDTFALLPDGTLVTADYIPKTKEVPFQINVALYDLETGSKRATLPLETYAAVSSIATSTDGRFIAAAHGGSKTDKRTVTIWDAASLKELKTWSVRKEHDRWVDKMEFSLDGKTLYCASSNNVVSAQKWQEGSSEVLYADGRVFPWALTIIGGTTWLLGWYFASRRRNSSRLSDTMQRESSATSLPRPALS